MDRTGVRWARAAVIGAIVVAAAAGVAGEALAGGGGEERPLRYVVRRGDTVWGIAQRIVGPDQDPRPMVDVLIQSNSLTGASIQPGQEIVVPP